LAGIGLLCFIYDNGIYVFLHCPGHINTAGLYIYYYSNDTIK
jgi:hypothetical protein